MSEFRLLSAPEQAAAHIRREILRGRWNEDIPGIVSLADELKVNHKTVSAALFLLETEGMLKAKGTGRNRRVVVPSDEGQERSMRVGMFVYEME